MLTFDEQVKVLAKAYPTLDFTAGHCHHLAIALQRHAQGAGNLTIGFRRTMDGEEVHISWFSHMVYTAANGEIYDIGGANADIRWEDNFSDLGEVDKWGLVDVMVWIDVDNVYPDYNKLDELLQPYKLSVDGNLISDMAITLMLAEQAVAVGYDVENMPSM